MKKASRGPHERRRVPDGAERFLRLSDSKGLCDGQSYESAFASDVHRRVREPLNAMVLNSRRRVGGAKKNGFPIVRERNLSAQDKERLLLIFHATEQP